jgi:hypothetical protein
MKHLFILTCLLPAFSQPLPAQDSLPQKNIVRSIKVEPLHGYRSIGYLYAMTDSALVVSAQKEPIRLFDTSGKRMVRFEYKDLETVEIYKKGQVWRSSLKGLLIGVAIGAAIGFASGDDDKDQFIAFTAGEKAAALGVAGGTAGTLTGLIIGLAAHKTFFIHGKKERYDRMRKKMINKLDL